MKFLGELIAVIVARLFKMWQESIAAVEKKIEQVKQSGTKAEEASQKDVSDVTGQDDIDFGTPDKPAPIKEGKNVRTKKKADDFFDSRNDRKRP